MGQAAETWVPVGPPAGPAPSVLPAEEWNWLGQASSVRRGRLRLGEGGPGAVAARVIAALILLAMALALVASMMDGLVALFADEDPAAAEEGRRVTRGQMMFGLVFQFVLFTVPPLLWVAAFYRDGLRAWGTRLFLRSRRLFGDFGWGVVAAFAMILGAVIVAIIVDTIVKQPKNEVVAEFGTVVDWPLVFLFAIVAGVSEEILFRGFLQPRIGIVPANVLFGLVHVNYGTPLQVVIPAAMGFVFSAMTIKRGSLLPAIFAHVTYDLVIMSVAKVFYG